VALVLELIASFAFVFLLLGNSASAQTLASSTSAENAPQMDITIRKSVQEVRVDFFLASPNGSPVPGLESGDFTIYQDNRPVPTRTGFYPDQNLPLQLLLMIDASDSMTRGFPAERNAAVTFLRTVVRPGLDHSAVASFATHLALDSAKDASSPDSLLRIGMLHSAGLTALYDSLFESASAFREYGEDSPSRRVLVLLSDGDDNYSLHSLDSAIAAAQKSNIVIYAITAHKANRFYRGDAVLQKITAETGGRFFVIKKFDESGKVFAEIEQEIRSQYSVTFRPAGDVCGYHSLRVEPGQPSLRARSRAGFYGDCP
jgi:Ca-activated chloride channel family protein